MKRRLTSLFPLLLPACTLDTPIVEGSNDVGENLGAWCESYCQRGTECGTVVPESCVADCVEYFDYTFFSGGGVCAEAAGRLMDCIDAASCDDLRIENACNIRSEQELCFESQGLAVCYGGVVGGGGDGSCDVDFGDCSDGRSYRLNCTAIGNPPECACWVDGQVTGTFIQTTNIECLEEFEAKQICGFPIAVTIEEPETPPLAMCERGGSSSAGGGASFYECVVSFHTCSDGHDYAVLCEGPPGAVDCYCSIDGNHQDQNRSPAGVCPFLDDPDYGIVATNYICGFRIAPPTIP